MEQIGQNESHVLMVAARRKDLYDILEDLEDAGVEPLRLDVEVHGCGYAFSRAETERDGEPFALFQLDLQSSLIGLVVNRQLRFSRAAPIATEELEASGIGITFEAPLDQWSADQNQWWNSLVKNLRRSITGFTHESLGSQPTHLIISGPGSEIPGLRQALEEELSLPVTPRLPISPGKLTEPVHFYSCPIGLALAEVEATQHINLVPEEIYTDRATARKKQFFVNAAILLVFNLLLMAGWLGHNYWHKQQILNIYQAKILDIRPFIRDIDEIAKKLNVISANIDRDNSAFKVARDLFERTPDRVKITQLTFSKSDSVLMNLETYTGADMDAYVKILGDSPFFAGTIDRGRLETIDLSRQKGLFDVPNYQKVTGTKCTLKTSPKLQEVK
jgi:hypothetical protein